MSHPQATITVYALSMRRQLCTSSGPSSWTLAALAPGPSWAMSTWKWRTLRLPSRPTGQDDGVFTHCQTFHSSVEELYQIILSLPCFSLCTGMPLKWTSGTTVPGMAWVRHMRSSRCPFTVCTIIERLTSLGMEKVFMQVLLRMKYAHKPNGRICFDILWCPFVGPMTRACWSPWVKATKNCRSKWKPRRCACYQPVSDSWFV